MSIVNVIIFKQTKVPRLHVFFLFFFLNFSVISGIRETKRRNTLRVREISTVREL